MAIGVLGELVPVPLTEKSLAASQGRRKHGQLTPPPGPGKSRSGGEHEQDSDPGGEGPVNTPL